MVIQKIKEWSPLAVLCLLVIFASYWAVKLSLTQQVIVQQTAKNTNEIQQIITFIQQASKVVNQPVK